VTTLREAVKTLFEGDATFMALATGGVHDADSLGRQQLELNDITAGTPIVQPALFIRWTGEVPFSASVLEARSVFCELYFFDDSSYDTIRQMRERAYTLLHQQTVTFDEPSSDYLYAFRWVGDVLEQTDDTLAGAFMERSRYEGHLKRN